MLYSERRLKANHLTLHGLLCRRGDAGLLPLPSCWLASRASQIQEPPSSHIWQTAHNRRKSLPHPEAVHDGSAKI